MCDRRSHYNPEVTPASDLDELISQLHDEFETDEVDVDRVKQIMSAYRTNPKDWIKFAKFDDYRYSSCYNGVRGLNYNCCSRIAGLQMDISQVLA